MSETVSQETNTYMGIADAHGIESFRAYEDNDSFGGWMVQLVLRAAANRHRHAVVYKVELGSNHGRLVQDAINDDDYPAALKRLKILAVKVELVVTPGDTDDTVERSFDRIPNPSLDPFRSVLGEL